MIRSLSASKPRLNPARRQSAPADVPTLRRFSVARLRVDGRLAASGARPPIATR